MIKQIYSILKKIQYGKIINLPPWSPSSTLTPRLSPTPTPSGKDRSIWFPIETTSFSIETESPRELHLKENSYRFSTQNDLRLKSFLYPQLREK